MSRIERIYIFSYYTNLSYRDTLTAFSLFLFNNELKQISRIERIIMFFYYTNLSYRETFVFKG